MAPTKDPGRPEGGAAPAERRAGRALPNPIGRGASPPPAPLRLADLPRRQRRMALVRSGATVALAWVVIFGAYYVLPFGDRSGLRIILRLGADLALVGAVFAWQIRRIAAAELPELRAAEALGIVIALFLAVFSGIYLTMAHHNAGTFTQTLDQTRALYFTVSVFSTVGFGDITPKTDPARLLVAGQMLLDLVILGAVVRVLLNAAKNRVEPAPGA